jgi:flagellar FliL protein
MKRLILMAVPLVLVLALAGGGVVFLVQSGGLRIEIGAPGAEATAAVSEHAVVKSEAERNLELPYAVGILYPTRERVVNLADSGAFRYLKIQVVLELAEPKAKPEQLKGDAYKKKQDELAKDMAARSALIEDQLTTILTSKTSAQLMTPEGKAALRKEMMEKLRPLVGEYKLLGVYFTQFIIQ